MTFIGSEANATLNAFLIKQDCLEVNTLSIQLKNSEKKKKANLEKEAERWGRN